MGTGQTGRATTILWVWESIGQSNGLESRKFRPDEPENHVQRVTGFPIAARCPIIDFMLRTIAAPLSEPDWQSLGSCEMQIDAAVERLASTQIDIRRELHAHPEPSGEEYTTTSAVVQRLRDAGLQPQTCRNPEGRETGAFVDLELGHPPASSPRIAIRADLDALRIPDEKTVEYRSRNPGVAHACGHDAHTAIVLGAALAAVDVNRNGAQAAPESAGGAADRPGEFTGGLRLRLLFQPAEETSQGAQWMVEQGALEGVAAILGLHVDPERQFGEVGIRYGVLTAYCDELEITVEGRGGHAARPHHTVDPVAVAAHLVGSLYEFLPRRVDSRNASVLTIGRISGGYAANVIPERVELLGTLRTVSPSAREVLKREVVRICSGAELTGGATVSVRFFNPLSAVHNDPVVTAALESAAGRVVGPTSVQQIDLPSMGGEDFAVYLEHVRGAMLRLGCAPPGGRTPFLHSPRFDLDERSLALGTRILLRAALLLGAT